MSIALITTRGFGNGTLVGTIGKVVTAGYDFGISVTIIGFHEGEVSVFTAYNSIITATNAQTGEVAVLNAVDLT